MKGSLLRGEREAGCEGSEGQGRSVMELGEREVRVRGQGEVRGCNRFIHGITDADLK